jgi:type I restriction enzyme S subunit
MSKWPTTALRGKIHVKHGFPFKGEHFQSSGTYVVLTPGNFHEHGGFKRNAEKDKCYSESFPDEYLLNKGDIIVAMTEQAEGLLGSTAMIPESGKFLHNQRLGLITAQTGEVLPEFIYHLFKTFPVRDQIRRTSSGSKVKHTSPERIYDVHVPLPPVKEQAAIAEVLTTIETKIALNHRINSELEGMAKLLYDYWFVQYDFPLSAAQAAALGKPRLTGQPYRTSGGPMVFDPQLKREVPEGWSAAQIDDLVPVGKETVNPSNAPDQVFKLFSIPVFDRSGTYSLEKGGAIGSNKFVVAATDLLVSKLNPWTSRVIYPPEDSPMICSTEFVVLQTGAAWMKNFLYMVTTNPQFIAFCSQSATGTSNSHKRVNPGVLTSFSFGYDTDVARRFGEIIHPMLLQRQINHQQNQELTTLRDWLLPMLMNGQVRVG